MKALLICLTAVKVVVKNFSLFDPAVLDEISRMKEKNIAVEISEKSSWLSKYLCIRGRMLFSRRNSLERSLS